MGKNSLGIKTSLFGFNRAQVVEYIVNKTAEFQQSGEQLKGEYTEKLSALESELNGQIDALKKELSAASERRTAAEEAGRETEQKYDLLTKAFAEKNSVIAEIGSRLQQAETNRKAVATVNSELVARNQELTARCDALSEQSDRLDGEREALTAENQRLTAENDALAAENAALRMRLSEARDLAAEAATPAEPSAAPLASQEASPATALDVRVGSLEQKLSDVNNTNDRLAAMVEELKCSFNSLRGELKEIGNRPAGAAEPVKKNPEPVKRVIDFFPDSDFRAEKNQSAAIFDAVRSELSDALSAIAAKFGGNGQKDENVG